MGILKNILVTVGITAVGIGAGFVGGAVYKDKTIDVTQTEEYIQVVDDNTTLTNELKITQTKLSDAISARNELQLLLDENDEQMATVNSRLDVCESNISTLQFEKINIEEQLSALEGFDEDVMRRREDLDRQYNDICMRIDDFYREQEFLFHEIEDLTHFRENYYNEFEFLNNRIQDLEVRINDMFSQLDDIMQSNNDVLQEQIDANVCDYYTFNFTDYATAEETLCAIFESNPSAVVKLTTSGTIIVDFYRYNLGFDGSSNYSEERFPLLDIDCEYYLTLDRLYGGILNLSFVWNSDTYSFEFNNGEILLTYRGSHCDSNICEFTFVDFQISDVETLSKLTFSVYTTADSVSGLIVDDEGSEETTNNE